MITCNKGDDNMYQRIRDLREDKDMTQEELAKALDMWLNTYRNYEVGNREPPFAFMIELAKYFNVSLDYLAGLIQTPERLDRLKK